ncbi:MAG: hypothetical protein ACRD1T_27255, partial [Acidimicrobiia bacterium]
MKADLPLFLPYEPVNVGSADPAGLAQPSVGLPIWSWPARLVSRLHPGLRESLAEDIPSLDRIPLPLVHLFLPGLAIAVVAIGSLIHLLAPIGLSVEGHGQIFPLGWATVFTESRLFMGFALLLGLISPALGVLVVLLLA